MDNILIVGDVMLDEYLWGDTYRISPEAPVPIVALNSTTYSLGGAANVAANVAGIGMNPILVGCVGKDVAASQLTKLCRANGISEYLFAEADRYTTVKTRVMARRQQMLRIDKETPEMVMYTSTRKKIIDRVKHVLKSAHGVIISDYAKGVLDYSTTARIIEEARKLKIPVFVDPKGTEWGKYGGATCITPNYKEYKAMTHPHNSMKEEAEKIISSLGLNFLVVTMGEYGMTVINYKGEMEHIPAHEVDVVDVSGAGDTVIAALTSEFCSNTPDCREFSDLVSASRFANACASVVVGRLGTSPITLEDICFD